MKRLRYALMLMLILAAAALWWWRAQETANRNDITQIARSSVVTMGPVSEQVIAQDDLPPAGTRSLFDHLLAQNDGLPYPFENLIELLQRNAPDDKAPLAVMIPLGRSLLKASADFSEPRVVFASDYHAANTAAALGIAPRGQLFLGFTEGANEIEVISYNEAAGRFEFQLVQNYCEGCAPRLVYARRAICLSCHQGGSPIFSVRPWQETNAQPEIFSRIVAARGNEAYLAVEPVQALSTPERIDELTDVGNFINVAQRIWLDGCGHQGLECRRLMLQMGLQFLNDPASFSSDQPAAKSLRELQGLHWPAQGIPVPDNDLKNRAPLEEKPTLIGRITNFFSPHSEPLQAARDNEDLEAFGKLPKLPAALDPLSPRAPKRILRAYDLDGVFGVAQFFTDADREQLSAAALRDWRTVTAKVSDLPDDLFAARPFSRVRVMHALLAILNDSQHSQFVAPSYCCLSTDEMSAPIAAAVPALEISQGSALESFERHCFACHRGNPAKRLNFMGGEDEAAVMANIKDTSAIRDALDWPRYLDGDKESILMPPADSVQRKNIEIELETQPNLLEEMRKSVPGLFDF